MIRDTRKPKAYFDQYIQYETMRIEKKQSKLRECEDPEKRGRIYSSLFLYQMNLLIASFSNGAGKGTLISLHDDVCSTAMHLNKMTYSDELTLLSISIMLNSFDCIAPVIHKYSDFSSDKLLHGLESYILTGKATWSGDYMFPDLYGQLDSVLFADSTKIQGDRLLEYLNNWYDAHSSFAWYDTLNSENDVYYGYWCFEASALACILKLDCLHLKTSEYFPSI